MPDFKVGDRVRAKHAIYEPADDHAPGGYVCGENDLLIVRAVRDRGNWPLSVSHEDVTDNSFSCGLDEVVPDGVEVRPTGPEPELAQDADRKLHRALATKPDSRMHAREAAEAIERNRAAAPGVPAVQPGLPETTPKSVNPAHGVALPDGGQSMSDRSKWPPVVGEQFVKAWINLKELPGGMMQSYSSEQGHFRYGPIPGTTSCGITTNPDDAQRWREQGQPVMEVYATHGVPGGRDETFRRSDADGQGPGKC